MKQKIFTYLFVFLLLLVLFQYVNSKRIFRNLNNKLESYKEKSKIYKDSLKVLQSEILELSHFNLKNNEDAN